MDCLFCKIIKGDIPSVKVYENHNALAFMDIRPINPGHVLVVSKKHFENMLEADDETLVDVALACKKVALAVKKALNPDGINLAGNNGRAAGQVIFHLHWHIIPRYEGDGLRLWPGRQDITQEELREVAGRIRINL